MRGEGVRKLQQALVDLGFMRREDQDDSPGLFGQHTLRALRAFQRAHRLEEDGIYGPLTCESLERALYQGAPSIPSTPFVSPRTENPIVRAFLNLERSEGAASSPLHVAIESTLQPPPACSVFSEEEAHAIHQRWKTEGACAITSTGATCMTRNYRWWRQRVDAFLVTIPEALERRAEEWRRWITQHEVHARWKLSEHGDFPYDPGPMPADFSAQSFEGDPLGAPPPTVFRRALLYSVMLPDGAQYGFRDDPVPVEDKSLVHENGVAKLGISIVERPDLKELLASAGITDPTELQVMMQVAAGEGGFESISTYDTHHIAAGFVPFVSGENGEGSLVQLLRRMKALSASEFDACFRSLGIDIDQKGLVVVLPDSGRILQRREAVHAIVDDKRLTALFYNAGRKSRAYQLAQLQLARELYYLPSHDFTIKALSRSGDKALLVTLSGKYGDVLTSEEGKAALMGRAVRRGPNNARQIFKEACVSLIQEKGINSLEALAQHQDLITPVVKTLERSR